MCKKVANSFLLSKGEKRGERRNILPLSLAFVVRNTSVMMKPILPRVKSCYGGAVCATKFVTRFASAKQQPTALENCL